MKRVKTCESDSHKSKIKVSNLIDYTDTTILRAESIELSQNGVGLEMLDLLQDIKCC